MMNRLCVVLIVFVCGRATAQEPTEKSGPAAPSFSLEGPIAVAISHPPPAADADRRPPGLADRVAWRVARRRALEADRQDPTDEPLQLELNAPANSQPELNPPGDSQTAGKARRIARSSEVPTYPESAPASPESAPANPESAPASPESAPEDETSTTDESTAPSAEPLLPPHVQRLRTKVETALDIYRDKTLNTREHCHWSLMHSLIAYGVEKQVRIGGPNGKPVNAIGWICYNYPCRGKDLFYLQGDNIRGKRGPGQQGHEGQFLAMVAQSRVKIDYPMKIDGRDLTILDLVRSEMATCKAGTELTFKLIGLAHYLDVDNTWKSDDGTSWDIEKLVREELKQPINGAACGGAHRLYGLAYGVYKCQKNQGSVAGDFERAERFLKKYHEYAFHLQNRDGSFSTEFFEGRGFDPDLKKRMLTSGHITEWLSFSLPKEQLYRPEMLKAIDYLANMLIRDKHREWEVGPLGHTLHALNTYHQRALSPPKEYPVVASLPADSE
ncbi:MAG TPA: hypothetical protein VMX74_12080 [Pirellulales bacterium]|nr:hypothetical protein [Pirellulales bacterium]